MKDLTQGSIPKHLVTMALPMMIGMFVQTLYFLVDLYFVGKLGGAALAGLSLAGNVMFLVFALTQILNVGTSALISHAVGRKDKQEANMIFNQSVMLATLMGIVVCLSGYLGAEWYLKTVSSDTATITAGLSYLNWFIPCMALQFMMVAISASLRGTGIVKPTMTAQMLSIVINIILSPILIEGWFTGHAMGIAGAGLASSISVVCAVLMLVYYFKKQERFIRFLPGQMAPNGKSVKGILAIGVPAGGEFFLMFVYMAFIYWLIQGFGAEAQAGFGLGSRIMQSLFLPAMAIAFAAPAVAGQNFGAKNFDRVRDTFKWSAIITCGFMILLTVLCLFQAQLLIGSFSSDENVLLFSAAFLGLICWNFVPSGLVFTCSGLFQSLGNTWPALLSTATRLLTFAVPAYWFSLQNNFYIEQIWYVSIASVFLQATLSYTLLKNEFRRRLSPVKVSGANESTSAPQT